MLFEESEESPGVRGFGFFGGKVQRFTTPGLKVPQIGWNQLELAAPAHPLWRGLPPQPHVYFVHSFFPEPTDPSVITARTTYGETFAASAAFNRPGPMLAATSAPVVPRATLRTEPSGSEILKKRFDLNQFYL